MHRAGLVILLLVLLALPMIAIGVTGSVWGGIAVAALEFAFSGFLRIRRPR